MPPSQRGQTLVLFTLFLAGIISLLLFALTDYAQFAGVYHAVDTAAQVGATAGASDIDRNALYQNRLALNATAPTTCQTAAAQQLALAKQNLGSPQVTCSPQGLQMSATVTTSIRPIFGDFGPAFQITSVRTAQGAFGQSHPLPFP